MHIRALKTTSGSYGTLRRGHKADVPDWEAKELIALGYAIEEKSITECVAAPQREAADKGDPFTGAPAGGRNGSAKQSSSSRRGRPRQKRQ